jgi:hypothetical protein
MPDANSNCVWTEGKKKKGEDERGMNVNPMNAKKQEGQVNGSRARVGNEWDVCHHRNRENSVDRVGWPQQTIHLQAGIERNMQCKE